MPMIAPHCSHYYYLELMVIHRCDFNVNQLHNQSVKLLLSVILVIL